MPRVVDLTFTVTQEDIDYGVKNGHGGSSYLCPIAHAVTVAVNQNDKFQGLIGHYGSYQARADSHAVTLESGATGIHLFGSNGITWAMKDFIGKFDAWAKGGVWFRLTHRNDAPKPFTEMIHFTNWEADSSCDCIDTERCYCEENECLCPATCTCTEEACNDL